MARTEAVLPAGTRITDYISPGVVTRFFPRDKVDGVLNRTGRVSVRERDLPAHVVVYYVIALALYMRSSYREVLRCLLEGVQWILQERVSSSRNRINPRGVKRKMSNYNLRPRKRGRARRIDVYKWIRIVK
jgi:hypothetical protein